MTSKRLSQLYYLKREIRQLRDRLHFLRAKAENITSNISPARGGGGSFDKTSHIITAIIDLERLIEQEEEQCIVEQKEIETYIATIPDSLTRAIFRARHIDCYTWRRVAVEVGGGNTAETVRKIHDRYLLKNI